MFYAASKKNNFSRRFNKRPSNNNSNCRDNSYRDMVPPTGNGGQSKPLSSKEHPIMLEGSSSEELKSWTNLTLTPILRKRGAMDLIDQPGLPRRGPPSDAQYATHTGSARERLQEVRKKEEDIQKFQALQGETFNEVVRSIVPGSVAYNHISQLVTEDVHGNNLNELIKALKEHIGGAGTIPGLYDHIISLLTFPSECEDCKPEHIIPRAYLFMGELKNFEITPAVPEVLAANGTVTTAAVPAVTCEMPEPLRVFFALAIASLAGNSSLVNEFVRREFGTKPLAEQKNFTKAKWIPVMETLKSYMKCDRDFSLRPEVTVAAHFTKAHDPSKGRYSGGGGPNYRGGSNFKDSSNGKSSGESKCMVCGPGDHKTFECRKLNNFIEENKGKRGYQQGKGKKRKSVGPSNSSSSSNKHVKPVTKEEGKFLHNNKSKEVEVSVNSSRVTFPDDTEFREKDVFGNGPVSSANYPDSISAWCMGTMVKLDAKKRAKRHRKKRVYNTQVHMHRAVFNLESNGRGPAPPCDHLDRLPDPADQYALRRIFVHGEPRWISRNGPVHYSTGMSYHFDASATAHNGMARLSLDNPVFRSLVQHGPIPRTELDRLTLRGSTYDFSPYIDEYGQPFRSIYERRSEGIMLPDPDEAIVGGGVEQEDDDHYAPPRIGFEDISGGGGSAAVSSNNGDGGGSALIESAVVGGGAERDVVDLSGSEIVAPPRQRARGGDQPRTFDVVEGAFRYKRIMDPFNVYPSGYKFSCAYSHPPAFFSPYHKTDRLEDSC